jgi:hypothetical protein
MIKKSKTLPKYRSLLRLPDSRVKFTVDHPERQKYTGDQRTSGLDAAGAFKTSQGCIGNHAENGEFRWACQRAHRYLGRVASVLESAGVEFLNDKKPGVRLAGKRYQHVLLMRFRSLVVHPKAIPAKSPAALSLMGKVHSQENAARAHCQICPDRENDTSSDAHLHFTCELKTSTAFSTCRSCPARKSAGPLSTQMSGGTP